jgi:hypothetical protein
VPRDAPDAAQRLAAAVAAGKAVGLPVWGAVRLLRERDAPPARQERNILGETPEAFVARQQQNPLLQRHPILGALAAKYGGWVLPDLPTLTRSLVALARVPGLAGLVLRDTAAPGYPEQVNDESRLFLNGEYGFIPEQRLAFLRKEGVDPIDIVTETYDLKASIPLPFFRDDLSRDRYVEVNGSPQKDPSFTPLPGRWNAFLTAANVALLEDLRAALRATRPDLPVLMDDRMSSYRDPNVGWFGSWDQPGLPPVNRAFASEEDALKLARSRSKRVLRSETFAGIACRFRREGRPRRIACGRMRSRGR